MGRPRGTRYNGADYLAGRRCDCSTGLTQTPVHGRASKFFARDGQGRSIMEFRLEPNQNPASDAQRAEILADPGFGQHFTDHMVTVDWTADQQGQAKAFEAGEYLKMVGDWSDARVEPYGPLSMSPAAAVLHYAQEIFEGLKAYRHDDGSIWTFRPYANAARMQRSAHRMAMPQLPEDVFVKALEQLMAQDSAWVPNGEGQSLYLRPFMIATEEFLAGGAAHTY